MWLSTKDILVLRSSQNDSHILGVDCSGTGCFSIAARAACNWLLVNLGLISREPVEELVWSLLGRFSVTEQGESIVAVPKNSSTMLLLVEE